MLAALFFLTPAGLLACLLALVPVAVGVDTARRQRRATMLLGLGAPLLGPLVGRVALAVVALLLLGLAVGQPVIERTETRRARAASEVVFVVDVSRSMLASTGPTSDARLVRARGLVADLRRAVADVPAGLSGLTDRVLPYLFPTLDAVAFTETLRRSVRLETPPPQQVAPVATDFSSLVALGSSGFFSVAAKRRTCVVVTDGETRGGDPAAEDDGPPSLGSTNEAESPPSLDGPIGCRLLVLRVGDGGDRIFDAAGRIEPQYRPEPTAEETVRALARAASGESFDEGELGDAREALRRSAAGGPTRELGVGTSARSLAPLLAALALALTLLWCGLVVRPDLLGGSLRH